MFHGISNDVLHSAIYIEALFEDDIGSQKIGSGTGFLVRNEKGESFLITNRHVVDIDYKEKTAKYKNFKLKNLVIRAKAIDPETNLPINADYFVTSLEEFKFHENYNNDIACLKNMKVIAPAHTSCLPIAFSIPTSIIADSSRIFNKLSVCDFVAFNGFPKWYDKVNFHAIFRTGTISSDPRFNYKIEGLLEGDIILYEAFSFAGSSGSPVFALQRGLIGGAEYREVMLVGINAGSLKMDQESESHPGLSYFFKSSAILELVNSF